VGITDELIKDYHNADIHRRFLRHICLHVELFHNEKDWDISEYDIQALMSQFVKKALVNTKYEMNRESFGKYDCAISIKSKIPPLILYEIKSYLKPNEKLFIKSSEKMILHDFNKLAKTNHKNVRGYFVLVFKKKEMDSIKSKDCHFIKSLLKKSRTYIRHDGIIIRPSVKDSILNTCCFSWEIVRKR